ncbi:barstar family protein [Serpentinicella sp. ANB-PHB4]|uniref:barstar family protein n=1 Tax=Serpentinicella sp. ANB-PHB4 TaxID=3074076 RepID=UPI0028614667|nr:barstar family protein [Serpentinicella sp. ANB-PHB4]MDR5659903.1 barstar family protein [Serpentinicella sp. ANB-PHB4]
MLLRLNEPYFHVVVGAETEFIEFLKYRQVTYKSTVVSNLIKGDSCKTTNDFYDEFSRVLQFPDYFGYNLSAFDECLNDLEWIEADGYGLFVSNAHLLLVDNAKVLEAVIKLLHNAAREWANGREFDEFGTPPTPFHIFLHCPIENQKEIRLRLNKAGVSEVEVEKIVL